MNLEFCQAKIWIFPTKMLTLRTTNHSNQNEEFANEAVDLRSKNVGGTDKHWDCASMVIWPRDGTSPVQHIALYNLAELSLDI